MKKRKQLVEIEIQVQIEKSRNLLTFLKENAQFIGEKHQIDTYYSPAHRNFIKPRPSKEWLRLRDSSGKYSINYKNWHYEQDGRSHFADEYESPVDDIKQVENIFAALDIKEVVKVDKLRKIWLYEDYEISIDSIKGLGDFVEIEFKGDDHGKDPADVTKAMIKFLKKFNVGKISRNYVGYPFQLLFPEEVKYEEF